MSMKYLGLLAVGLFNSPAEYLERASTRFQRRFWQSVGGVGDMCWIWQGRVNNGGYGVIECKGKSLLTHIIAYALTHGCIPEGHFVLHGCDNRSCCNPTHLRAGTRQENTADMLKRKRHRGRIKTTDQGFAL